MNILSATASERDIYDLMGCKLDNSVPAYLNEPTL
jgi:hypothetical protein